MNTTFVKVIKALAFFGFGLLILYLVFRNQQLAYFKECELKGLPAASCSLLDKVMNDFKGSHFQYLILSVLIFMFSNILRAWRWSLLLQPLGYHPKFFNTFGTTMIGYLLNLSLPRAGEIAKPVALSKYENIPLNHTMGTIVTDRIMDVICLGLLFVLTLVFASGTVVDYLANNMDMGSGVSSLVSSPLLISILVVAMGAIGLGVWKNWDKLRSLPLIGKVVDFGEGVWQAVISVSKMRQKGLFVVYTLGIWICYYLMIYVIFFAYDPTSHLDWIAGLVVLLFGSLGMVIPSPGGMGSYHFLVGQALLLYGLNGADGFSFANLIFFTIQIFGNILFGGMSMILLPILNKGYNPESNAEIAANLG